MNILFASTPATGHINPLLAIVHILRAEGHEITFLTGSAFRDRIENSGAKFVSLQAAQISTVETFSRWLPNSRTFRPDSSGSGLRSSASSSKDCRRSTRV
jgi:UDP:flavonoid glycosyltransferase YjiC (YdhE family)